MELSIPHMSESFLSIFVLNGVEGRCHPDLWESGTEVIIFKCWHNAGSATSGRTDQQPGRHCDNIGRPGVESA